MGVKRNVDANADKKVKNPRRKTAILQCEYHKKYVNFVRALVSMEM